VAVGIWCTQWNFLNLAADNPALLIVWHLRKIDPRPEISPPGTAGTATDSVTLFWVIWTSLSLSSYCNAQMILR